MKTATLLLFSGALLLSVACNNENTRQNDQTLSDTVVNRPEANPSPHARQPVRLSVITGNAGRYPREIRVFDDPLFVQRTRALLGSTYEELVQNFNVETPIAAENGIYKFTGCKQNDCPAFQATFLYDAAEDNLNILIDRNGQVKYFNEKGKINYTDSLRGR